MHSQRQQALHLWLETVLPEKKFTVTKLAGDASFRHYHRIRTSEQSFVAMDAPPDKENCQILDGCRTVIRKTWFTCS